MLYFALSLAITWTKVRKVLAADFVFPNLLLLSSIIHRLMDINRNYQNYQRVLGYYNQFQAFMSVKDVQSHIADQRLIAITINHCLVNDLSVLPSNLHLNLHERAPRNQDQIQVMNASVTLRGTTAPIFNKFSVSIPRGRLTVVMGASASGKSQFLKVLLNEVTRSAGQLYIEPGVAIAYCGQDIWLQHKSIKDNIIGNQGLDQTRYSDIIQRCQLSEDLDALPNRDNTILGGNMSSLSNSQQYKVVRS